jgi:hypothetical protein
VVIILHLRCTPKSRAVIWLSKVPHNQRQKLEPSAHFFSSLSPAQLFAIA